MRCRACGKFISPAAADARCSIVECSGAYHKACIAIPENAKPTPNWKCPECKNKKPKGNNSSLTISQASNNYVHDSVVTSEEAVRENVSNTIHNKIDLSKTSSLDLGIEIRLLREELREVRRELKDFRFDLSQIRSAGCSRRIDVIEERLTAIETDAVALDDKESIRAAEIRTLEETVGKLQEDLNDRDQELLHADLEITNIPEVKGENPIHTVTVLTTKLGMELDIKDVILAERIGRNQADSSQRNGEDRGRRLIVRLARRSQRGEMIKNARVRRAATTADMDLGTPPRRFFINERLTKTNRRLFYIARETARKMEWKYVQPAYSIKTDADIPRVFQVFPNSPQSTTCTEIAVLSQATQIEELIPDVTIKI